jgi:hypothetical protein
MDGSSVFVGYDAYSIKDLDGLAKTTELPGVTHVDMRHYPAGRSAW